MMRGQRLAIAARWSAIVLGLALTAAGPAPMVAPETIEKRADCITNEGGDLPPADAAPQSGPAAPINDECVQAVIDGKFRDDKTGEAAITCLIREIAVWDGVLDRLVRLSADRRTRQTLLKAAIAAFRDYRDKSCSTFHSIAVNTPPVENMDSCRLTETTRFAQTLYQWFYSP